MKKVKLIGTGSYLPGNPVKNADIDKVLGKLENASTKVKGFIETVGSKLLKDGGVEYRHFAIDTETGDLTESIASMAEKAARNAISMAKINTSEIDLIVLSSHAYDYGTPPTSVILQDRLGIKCCAEFEIHSNCSGVGKSVQVAFDALRLGRYKKALIVYSQLSSSFLRSTYFNQSKISRESALLRYILADGAGAIILEAVDHEDQEQLIIDTYVESVGGEMAAAMTAGYGMADLMADTVLGQYDKGLHHLCQDFNAVNKNVAEIFANGLYNHAKQIGLNGNEVDKYIISVPNEKMYTNYINILCAKLNTTKDRIPYSATNTGYCGGATLLIHFDEMVRKNIIKRGEVYVIHAVESSKWMTGGFSIRW
jgi:3-oxoacyl-[acyl-carrier-protein] synthase-3